MTSLTIKKAHTSYEEVMAKEEVVVLTVSKPAYVSSTLVKFNMETYVSTTADQSSSIRWVAMVILLLISQVQGQALDLVRWSPHTPAVIGQSVTLACVFNRSTTCTWSRSNHTVTPTEVRSNIGYSYDGDYKKAYTKATTNCSLTIDAVTREDLAMWYCTGFSTSDKHSPWTYITEQVTPSAPVIRFDNVNVSEIEFPSRYPLSHMVCRSESGNPAPSLHWEVNGTVYKGKLKTTPADTVDLYTVELHWDESHRWQMLDYVSEIICKAIHPGFQNTVVAKVELRHKYAPRTVKVLADGFSNNNITIERSANVTLSCISDGHPRPTNYTWESWSEPDKRWTMYRHNEQNMTATTKQLGKYRCKASNQLNQNSPTTSINQIIVTESMAPTAPVIRFNNETVSSINVPSSDPPSHIVCRSQSGNPPPQLQWEVDGIRYFGRQDTIYVGAYLSVNELRWSSHGGWHTFDHAIRLICRAKHPGHRNTSIATVALTHTLNGSSDETSFGLIVGVGGGIIFVAVVIIVILTVAHVKLRQRLRKVEMGSKSTSEASLAQVHRSTDPPATANPTIDVTPPDTDADRATYGNVGWTNPEPNVHWEPMRIYE